VCGLTASPSSLQLALCYKQGKGVSNDKREAVYWFRKAAAQGHTVAQAFLQGTLTCA
jgi:TPR repeat protein